MTRLVDSVGLLALAVAGIGLALFIGRIVGGKRAPWLGPVLAVMAGLSGPTWLAAAFDQFGERARAVVVRRVEAVRTTWNGGFERRFSLDLKYAGRRSDESFPVSVDQARYDQVAFGDPVTVVALPARRSIARLDAMSAREWLGVVMPWGALTVVASVAALVGGLLLYGGAGAAGTVRKVIAAVLFAGGGWSCYQDNRPFEGAVGPGATPVSGTAVVHALHRVTHIGSTSRRTGWTLPAPYQLVELEFVPRGYRAAVIAVDAIDDGSIPYLAVPQSLAIRYDPANPRRASISSGSRRFAEDNTSVFRTWTLIVVGALAGIAGLTWLAGRRR